MGILDFLFPKYCVNCRKLGDYLCPDCFSFLSFNDFELCLACNKPSIDGLTHKNCRGRHIVDGSFSSLKYKGVVKKLIYNFKYKPYLADLDQLLVDLFHDALIQKERFNNVYENFNTDLVLVPIPLHLSRFKSRGYNHAELLARGLSRKLNIPVILALKRVRNTKSQFGLKKEERKENIAGAFKISNFPAEQDPASRDKYNSILLVDDILTTGSTLLEAARVLKQNGARRVWGITLARD